MLYVPSERKWVRRPGAANPKIISVANEVWALGGDLKVEEGLIRHLGISNIDLAQFTQARTIAPIVCVQNAYNIANRGDDALVDACLQAGVAYVPFYPVGGFQPLMQENNLAAVANRHAVTAAQVALAWLLARSPNILPIPGTGSLDHLAENAAAAELMTAEDLALLG